MIKVIIIAGQEIIRHGMSTLLKCDSSVHIMDATSNGHDAIKQVSIEPPDIILMDIQLPNMDALELIKRLLRNDENIKIIVLSEHEDDSYLSRLFQVGISGYITKRASKDEIIHAVKSVHNGQKHVSQHMAKKIAFRKTSEQSCPFESLSDREMQITRMITTGQRVADISKLLCISTKTVNSYRYRVFEKLAIDGDVALTHMALKHGLIKRID